MVSFYLASFSQHSVSFVHVVECSSVLFSLLNIIAFYEYATICWSNLFLMDIWVISGLVLFLILLLLKVFQCIPCSTFAGICVRHKSKSEFAGSLIIWVFNFSNTKSFYKVVVPVCILPSSKQVFCLLHILANICYGQTFHFSNWGSFVAVSHFVFNLHWVSFFIKRACKSPLLIFLKGCQSLSSKFLEVFQNKYANFISWLVYSVS